jgi:hypothetical protein
MGLANYSGGGGLSCLVLYIIKIFVSSRTTSSKDFRFFVG